MHTPRKQPAPGVATSSKTLALHGSVGMASTMSEASSSIVGMGRAARYGYAGMYCRESYAEPRAISAVSSIQHMGPCKSPHAQTPLQTSTKAHPALTWSMVQPLTADPSTPSSQVSQSVRVLLPSSSFALFTTFTVAHSITPCR